MPVQFTKHARERMEERGITIAQVFRVLAFGHSRPSCGNPVWEVDLDRVEDSHWKQLLDKLKVVCTPELCVVTVYREGQQYA